MLKKIFTVIAAAFFAFTAFAATAEALKTGTERVIAMPRGNALLKCKKDAVTVVMECPSDVLPTLKKKYAKLQWDVFSGENVDLTFSPCGGWPNYRLRLNPSGKFFCSFNGNAKWQGGTMTGKAEFTDTGWRATFVIPYAALESDENAISAKPLAKPRYYLPTTRWVFSVSRKAMNAQGKIDLLVPAGAKPSDINTGVNVILDEELIEPYRQIHLRGITVPKVGTDGKGVLKGAIYLPTQSAFTGKLLLHLHEGKAVRVLAESPVSITKAGDTSFAIPFAIGETGEKLSLHLELQDSEGTTRRVSRILVLENPWAE